MPLAHRETVETQGVEAALLDVGEGHIELLRPLGEDTPVGKFVAKKGGPGMHHVAYAVEDIDTTLAPDQGVGPRADRLGAPDRHPRLAASPSSIPAPPAAS